MHYSSGKESRVEQQRRARIIPLHSTKSLQLAANHLNLKQVQISSGNSLVLRAFRDRTEVFVCCKHLCGARTSF